MIIDKSMLGSGTTAIAALANRRKFIGCEKAKSVIMWGIV
jgi:DNA modification methylase